MMKNKSLILIHILAFIFYGNAQSGDYFYSAPSASSLSSYVKSPVSVSSGVPDISIPFFSLPTRNKGMSVNAGISYHPNGTGRGNSASDVGLGWSLFGVNNLIYREINPYDGSLANQDVFYYSFMGISGKFQVSELNGELSIRNLSTNLIEISGTKTNNVYSFNIKDRVGNSYAFDKNDLSYYRSYISNQYESYQSASYLTKISDAHNNEILKFNYLENNYVVNPNDQVQFHKTAKSFKIEEVISSGMGSIFFSYTLDNTLRKTPNDIYKLNTIELKNSVGKIIQKSTLEYEMKNFFYNLNYNHASYVPCTNTNVSKRVLTKLHRYGSSTIFETTRFNYNAVFAVNTWVEPAMEPIDLYNSCYINEEDNPKYFAQSLLSSIKFPNGTQVKYEFEPNQYFVEKNTPEYYSFVFPNEITDREVQYWEDLPTVNFDTKLGTNHLYNIPVNSGDSNGDSYLRYWLHIDEIYPLSDNPFWDPNTPLYVDASISGAIDLGWTSPNVKKYASGNHTVSISGSGGKGRIFVKRIMYKPLPRENFSSGYGVRIKKIEYYDGNNLVDTQTKNYSYSYFNGSNATSGILVYPHNSVNVVYKNVKETIGNNLGYTKFYFKTLEDYPENIDVNGKLKNELKYYSLVQNGIFDKKEVYNSSNDLLTKDQENYEFHEYGSSFYITTGITPVLIDRSIIKKQTSTSTQYLNSGSFSVTNEINRSIAHQNITSKKTTGFDGTISEEIISYPSSHSLEPHNSRLLEVGIQDVPLIVESKRDGVTVSKSETKYEDVNHYYPTSQIGFLPDNLSQSEKSVSYDLYDDKGNVVQFTTLPDVDGGNPTTIIWGYNKTVPIAKIDGAKLSDIPAALITSIVNASDADGNATTQAQEDTAEKALIDALNLFRTDASMQNFVVTCYTYNPLIGLTNTIPPTGIMETYIYDSFNRLLRVVDVNGKTLKEHLYNTRN